jgi:peptidoglycan/LPS O-acetylase OafA/YrhL
MIFDNYEIVKIDIAFPTINNFIIILLLLIVAIISTDNKKSLFMDTSQTDQLKGVAILLIVISHLWFHVSKYRAIPMLGDYSVSLFLMLSGYGLTQSLSNRALSLGDFVSRRIKKVFVPYWIITIIILIIDYFILNRFYSLQNIMLTLAGVNLNPVLRQLDYARWFITLLLIYYVVFFLANRSLKSLPAIYLLCLFGIFLLLLKHYGIFHIGKYHQAIAFPIGCIIAYFHEDLKKLLIYRHKGNLIVLIITILIIIVRIPLLLIVDKLSYSYNITALCVYNATGLLFCLLMILVMAVWGAFNYRSNLLLFCGAISYEIYLIHGPLLIKYNPFIKLIPVSLIVASFMVYLFCVLMLSYWFSKLNKILY